MQTMILTSQDQLKNLDNVGAVLVYPSKITTSGLIQSATSNDLVVNCIVDDDPDNAFIGQSLSQLGYPSGCYIAINYQNKKTAKEITDAFSSNLQLGYRAAIIINKSDYTQDDFKVFSQYGIIVIDHNDVKNHILTVPEFLTSRSLAMIRDYTNVDISNVGPGAFVGVGKDTSGLGGGRSFGYSTNGQDFYAVITPKGLVFRQIDALRMWRLLKPQQAAQIGDFFNNKVAKEIEEQNESLKSAVETANSAVNAANQAVNDSKVNSDAINAMKSATSSVKSDADAAMEQASSAVSAISDRVAQVENSIKDNDSANKSDMAEVRKNISDAQQTISDVSKSLSSVSANLDTYAKSAAEQGHDITSLKNQQGKLEADMASVSGNVAQLTATTDKLQANIKDNSGNIASLQETASQTAVSIQNAQSQVASVIATAGQLQSLITDQNKQITSIQQTASAASVSASDAKSNAVQAQLTASAATVVAGNASAQALSLSATASEAKLTATNASSQAMQANATASGVAVELKSVEGNVKANSDKADSTAQQLSAVSQKVTTNEANISATQKQIEAKADQVTVDNLNKTVSSQAGEIQANANGLLLKADKTVTDALNKSVQEQQAQQNILADQITSKVSSADVEKMIDGKGFATKDLVESSITQASGKINESITNLQGNLQNITADLTGLQSTVKNKADQSQITQLANALQVKLSGSIIAQATDVTLTYTGAENEYPLAAPLVGMNDVDKGSTLILSFDYVASADTKFTPQLDGEPWIPWGSIDNATPAANGEKGSYSKTITVNDDSWQNGNAKNLCIRCDGFKGTIEITNLVLKYADTTLNDAQSSFDMLRDDINLRVQKGDLISQINLEAGQTLIQSKKLFLDADSVVFSGKAFIPDAAITNLNGDKITAGHISVPMQDDNGNTITLGNGGINIASALSTDSDGGKTGFSLNLSSSGLNFINHREDNEANNDYRFLQITPGVLHDWTGATDQVTKPSGLIIRVPKDYSSQLGPTSPGGFLAIGSDVTGTVGSDDKQIAIAYVNKKINGWEEGLNIHTVVYIKPYGVTDNGLRTGWVSFSNWDNGERYPAIVNNQGPMGGVAFPRSSKVTLFDSYGQAFWPTQNQFNTKDFQWGW
jgi:hypothetical protein